MPKSTVDDFEMQERSSDDSSNTRSLTAQSKESHATGSTKFDHTQSSVSVFDKNPPNDKSVNQEKRSEKGKPTTVPVIENIGKEAQPTTLRSSNGVKRETASTKKPTKVVEKKEESETDSEAEKAVVLKYGAKHLIQLVIPTTICVFITVFILNFVHTDPKTLSTLSSSGSTFAQDEEEPALSTQVIQALVILGVVIGVTVIILVLYLLRLYKILFGIFAVQGSFISMFLLLFTIFSLCKTLNAPFDFVSTVLLVWNLCIPGLVAAFWKGPMLVQQTYYILLSSVLASHFVLVLPQWTIWALIALLAVWDLVAVLAPCGPLRLLLNKMMERSEKGEEFKTAGLLYSAGSGIIVGAAEVGEASPSTSRGPIEMKKKDSSISNTESERSGSEDLEDEFSSTGAKLGLGDFIFYSIMVGSSSYTYRRNQSSDATDWNTTMACFVGVVVGLCVTVMILSTGLMGKRMLPALPISIFLGLIFHFSTNFIISPFSRRLTEEQLFL